MIAVLVRGEELRPLESYRPCEVLGEEPAWAPLQPVLGLAVIYPARIVATSVSELLEALRRERAPFVVTGYEGQSVRALTEAQKQAAFRFLQQLKGEKGDQNQSRAD